LRENRSNWSWPGANPNHHATGTGANPNHHATGTGANPNHHATGTGARGQGKNGRVSYILFYYTFIITLFIGIVERFVPFFPRF